MNNVTKNAAYNIRGDKKPSRGRPRLYPSNAAKQAAHRQRKRPARIEPGARVRHGLFGKGIVTQIHGDRFIVAFQSGNARKWLDLAESDLTFVGRVKKMPAWTDSGRPLSKNWKPPREWKTPLPAAEVEIAVDGQKIAVPVYGVRKAGRRKTRRDFTKFIDHNLAAMVELAYGGKK